MDVFVARQAIFDRARRLFAYELLFRSDPDRNEFIEPESGDATTQVVANTLLSIGLENLLRGKKAFVNFDRNSLVGGLHSILSPESTVVELLESVEPDPEVVEMCERLRQQGYLIALDDFVRRPRLEPLTEIAGLIKVDIRCTPRPEQTRLLAAYKPRGIKMLAEKVETQDEFEWAHEAGYDLFQGYFFARPVVVRGREIPAVKITCLQLLGELQRPDLDFDRIDAIIRQDVSLPFKLFRYANSARFQRSSAIRSISHALAILGEPGIRHWAVLATLPALAQNKPGELITLALLRARFCELLARAAGHVDPNAAFLMGLFSLLDAMIDMELAEALRHLNVIAEVSAALLGNAPDTDPFTRVFRLSVAYEVSDWNAVKTYAASLGLPASVLSGAYSEAVVWAQEALHDSKRAADARRRKRHAVQGNMTILWKDEDERERMALARLTNISVGGLQLQTTERIALRTGVYCSETKLGIAGRGWTKYCHFSKGKYIIGLEFPDGTGWREPASEADEI